MYHRIEFQVAFIADVEISPRHRLEQLRVRRGTRVDASLRPCVVETAKGPVEAADLHVADGTVLRQVPYEWFRFVD
jgi:hypothetical protein